MKSGKLAQHLHLYWQEKQPISTGRYAMHHSYPQPEHHATESNTHPQAPVAGAWLSIVGLVAWLTAMALAVAGPLLNIEIPAAVIVGMVVFSGIFSLLSLPRLLNQDNDKE